MQSIAPLTSSPLKSMFRLGLCAALLFGNLALFAPPANAQEAAPTTEAAAAAKPPATLMDKFHHGGWVMYPITLCSVAMVWLVVDLWMRTAIKKMAEAEGLDQIFIAAGAQWRGSGCSSCAAMNGDTIAAGQRCASTSNRNFEGRQGKGARTHLMSPAMAAAAAVTGCLTDIRKMKRA